MTTLAVYFGGFQEDESSECHYFLTLIGHLQATPWFANYHSEDATTLAARRQRAEWEGDPQAGTSAVHVVGYSMGSHLAVWFGDILAARHGATVAVTLHLLAPDPKYRKSDLDFDEDGDVYDDARAFWKDVGVMPDPSPGHAFERSLGRVRGRGCPVLVVYSRCDTVAQWPGNVRLLGDRFANDNGVRWAEWRDLPLGDVYVPPDDVHAMIRQLDVRDVPPE